MSQRETEKEPNGPSFKEATHTIILSDIHLTEALRLHPRNPLWKRYKSRELFIDESFQRFLEYVDKSADSPVELILNGDIFDFDSVTALPEAPAYPISWLEQKRGLMPEEEKSRFKIQIILRDHELWAKAMGKFLQKGHRVIFIIGNHDVELHWPAVQTEIRKHLGGDSTSVQEKIRFCEWFYVSNGDTMVEHGNQYDPYTVCQNPAHPLISKGGKYFVRIPFGNWASRLMVNGMGFFNPHVDNSFIKSGKEYVVFYLKYVVRTEPFLLLTWFWGAVATFFHSLSDGLHQALIDPITMEERTQDIAHKSNATPGTVRRLMAVHAWPAIFNPFQVLRELWLDRALLLLIILFFCFQFFSFLNIFANVSVWWFLIPLFVLFPLFVLYSRSVESDTPKIRRMMINYVRKSAHITKLNRYVLGHTHKEHFIKVDGIEIINSGTWSAAYRDVACTIPMGKKCFVWIRPSSGSGVESGSQPEQKRLAQLWVWDDPGASLLSTGQEVI